MKKFFIILLAIIILGSGVAFLFLSKSPIEIDTNYLFSSLKRTEKIRSPEVQVVAENLKTPWSLVFLPDNTILITERGGTVRLIDTEGSLQTEPVIQLEEVVEIGEGGLLGIDLHPNFNDNNLVYLYYTYQENDQPFNRVVRMTYEEEKLVNQEIILDRLPAATYHNGGRIKFGPDGYLYITTGDALEVSKAQDVNFLGGKILRVTDLGETVSDNPYNNEVYSYGHRNSQGIAWDAEGNLWSTEHGRSGAKSGLDELNLITKGGNYGWPLIEGDASQEDMLAPNLHSGEDKTWAPAGATAEGNSIFFTGLRGETLYQVIINYETMELTLKEYFKGEFGRLRDVVIGPDNFLYFITNNTDGRGNPANNDDRLLKVGLENLF